MKTQEFIDTDLVSSTPSSDERTASVGKASPQVSQSQAETHARIEQARQQILELRRQQDELERLRQELEDLRRREDEFEHGKIEMLEELSRTITSIEQEEFELNKRAAMLVSFRELYQDYIRQLSDIHENEWSQDELKTHLTKAVSVVDAARAELNKGRAQLSFLGEGPIKLAADTATPSSLPSIIPSMETSFNFKLEFQKGLARSLPFIIALVCILILWLVMGRK